ncbi:hypothetical protein Ahy_A02g005463 [Arachis hypogaea]|uniref:Uncharacterized protein n=1 Tax=Arachis hypogaea TaxID=3818 RepID=A0A445E6R6_ARAHY|nr:hypothetical protein Ahy_A02g005463 [Arachis hypogaea]
MLEDVREWRNHLTSWLCLEIKKALYVHWETNEGFSHQCLTNRANRTSVRSSKYIGGSATFMKTKVRLAQELTKTQERYQKIFTRMTATDDLRLEWREQLEQFQRMEAQIEVSQVQMRIPLASAVLLTVLLIVGGTQISPLPQQGHGNDN